MYFIETPIEPRKASSGNCTWIPLKSKTNYHFLKTDFQPNQQREQPKLTSTLFLKDRKPSPSENKQKMSFIRHFN